MSDQKTKSEKRHYTYMLRCRDDSLYTGYTTDLKRRLQTHNDGKGAKYTKARLPVEMVYHETFATKEEAMRREAAIKKLSRQEKLRLIKEKTNEEGIKG